MSMKMLTKVLLGITLSTATLGAAVGGAVLSSNHSENLEVAEAANTGSSGDVIYFTPSNHWAEADATFKLQWYKNNNYVGSTFMSAVSESGGKMCTRTTYWATVTAAFDAVQILRFNPGKSSQWNYSNNSAVSGSNRWLVMTAGCTWDNTWCAGDSSGTYWSNVDFSKLGTDQSASSSTTRVFVNNSGSHFNPVGIRAWGGDASPTLGGAKADATIYHFSWFEDINSVWYGYAEIPNNATGFKIIKLSDDTYNGTPSYYQDGDELTTASLASQIIYCPSSGNTLSFGGAKDDQAGPSLMSKLLEAIDTCSSSTVNGYGAYSNLNNYFYSHATAEAKATSCTSLGGVSKTVQEHFEGMARRPGSLPGSNYVLFNTAKNDISVILIAVSVISGIALTGFGLYFFKKRKSVSK